MLKQKRLLIIISLLFLSTPSFARVVCPFKPPHPEISENCSDLDFTQAIWASDFQLTKAFVDQNPNYVFACHIDPNNDFDQFSTLTFAICKHGDQKDLPQIVRFLLANGADARHRF